MLGVMPVECPQNARDHGDQDHRRDGKSADCLAGRSRITRGRRYRELRWLHMRVVVRQEVLKLAVRIVTHVALGVEYVCNLIQPKQEYNSLRTHAIYELTP